MEQIKIGTLISADEAMSIIPDITDYGFETFSITFWKTIGKTDIKELAKRLTDYLAPKGITISSLSIFTNPLSDSTEFSDAVKSWETLIDNASLFGTNLVTGFTGRIIDKSIDDSINKFQQVFGELSKRAASKGVKIAFENCTMGGNWEKGNWNIAHNPAAWELMFNALPEDNLGLQWEPCHQMVQLIDPIPQLKKWAGKIFNVHGKDATIDWDIIKKYGIGGYKQFAWHRTPGFGDSNWTDIISILRMNNYTGSIDIEGYHDPVYNGKLELTGQVHALNYLKQCRGGNFIENPVGWKDR
ncbi:sugar phosphate isomerase/epimerase family protein [Vallitalea guaymasensis]|uniref:Sugar phosphate isomerase/epimerase n=1 Tax=Vallitalea guaymasensis TaxID=1185412 RepID=A0A8J8MB85_9FIRM|nr:sugar phosphate isomerase/epimerase [Vallitalea guaymasensis]QUH29706.1 sugar phosphate isomerase/epimerase [Vallitalea guaymasensis]